MTTNHSAFGKKEASPACKVGSVDAGQSDERHYDVYDVRGVVIGKLTIDLESERYVMDINLPDVRYIPPPSTTIYIQASAPGAPPAQLHSIHAEVIGRISHGQGSILKYDLDWLNKWADKGARFVAL